MSSVEAAAAGGAYLAPVFAALGDPTRLSIISRLSDGQSRSIARLSGEAAITRQAITKHLRVLESAGLVRSIRHGRESRFALEPRGMAGASAYLDQVSRQWDDILGRLRALVEDVG